MQDREMNPGIKLQIDDLRSAKKFTDLNCQKQEKIKGGLNEGFYNFLIQNDNYITLEHGIVAPGEYEVVITIDRGTYNNVTTS